MILYIDTHDQHSTLVAVEVNGSRYEKLSDSRVLKSQMVLPLIESLLSEQGLTVSDISSVRVHTGPGSFTGIRVGLAIANSIATLLHIPVNGSAVLAKAKY